MNDELQDLRRWATGWALSPQDAWITATALALDAPLATNNRRDFEHVRKLRMLSF